MHMNFLFEHPTECKLHLIKELYANWEPIDPNSKLKIHWYIVIVMAHVVNEILEIPEVDAVPLR